MITSTPNGRISEEMPSLPKKMDTACMIPPASWIFPAGTTIAMATLPRMDKVATVAADTRTDPG
jgi:hypothetical protein